MARERFEVKDFHDSTLVTIAQAAQILEELSRYRLTLRQLYYQFVARGLIPNRQREYNRLGRILNDARLAGLIDWSSIEDRTRNLRELASWDSPVDVVEAVADQYREDPWETQPYRPEVWIEKDALVGVIEPVCNELRVPFFACRGYTSQSETYAAGKRLGRYARDGQRPIIFHLGDHDPSGIDMTRDNHERLSMFARRPIPVVRLALNFDQVEQYDPPPNPAKVSDSRYEAYAIEHGHESWELDALDPSVIETLIQDALDEIIDQDAWDEAMEAEQENRGHLERAAKRWVAVVGFLNGKDGAE